jgi:uncharacterized membrane protein
MNIPTIEPISMALGAGLIVILFIIVKLVTWLLNRNRGHTLNEMKGLVQEAHQDMFNANQKLSKLYKTLNEVEQELNK